MPWGNLFTLGEVGDSSSDAKDSVMGTRRQVESIGSVFEQCPTGLIELADCAQRLAFELRIRHPLPFQL